MEPRDLENIRRGYEALNRGDFDAALAMHAPDIELQIGAGTFHGREATRRWVEDLVASFGELKFEIERLIDAGEQAVALLRVSGRGLQSGAVVDQRPAHVLTVREGKVVRLTSYADRHKALAAAGIRE